MGRVGEDAEAFKAAAMKDRGLASRGRASA